MTKRYPGSGQLGTAEFPVELVVRSHSAAAAGDADDVVEMIASTEHPMERYGMSPGGQWGPWREQLEHSAGAVQLGRLQSGRAPVLIEHFRPDQIGVITKAELTARKLRLATRFSRVGRGPEFRQDVEDRIRRSVSMGWVPKRAKLIEEDPEKGDLWRITLWEPVEVSMVSVPANPEARVASNQGGHTAFPQVVVEGDEKGSQPMLIRKRGPVSDRVADPADPTQGATGATTPGSSAAATPDPPEIIVDDQEKERQRFAKDNAEIFELCRVNGYANMAAKWIGEGLSRGEIAEKLVDLVRTGRRSPEPRQASSEADAIGMNRKERNAYSYHKVIRGLVDQLDGRGGLAGLELEVHQALHQKRPNAQPERGGILVPMDLRTEQEIWDAQERRAAMDSKTPTKGSEVVFDQPGQLIELLRNTAVVIQMGAQTFTGLTGPVGFPKQTGPLTAQWVGENPGGPVAASDLAFGIVQLQPKSLQATTAYTRQLLAQASIEVEPTVRNDFAAQHALAIDRAVIHGLGAAGEPVGIYAAPAVNVKAMGGQPDYIKLVDMVALVATKNAIRGALGFITTPGMAGRMKTTPEHPTAGIAGWIWQGQIEAGTMVGYRALSTNQVSSLMSGSAATGGTEHGIIFGNWAEVIIGFFQSLEIVVDPYALKKLGIIEVTSFQMVDSILRHGESFTKATGATTP